MESLVSKVVYKFVCYFLWMVFDWCSTTKLGEIFPSGQKIEMSVSSDEGVIQKQLN